MELDKIEWGEFFPKNPTVQRLIRMFRRALAEPSFRLGLAT